MITIVLIRIYAIEKPTAYKIKMSLVLCVVCQHDCSVQEVKMLCGREGI